MAECVYTEDFKLRYREVDRNGFVKTQSWFDFMQEAAAEHATILGAGYSALADRGCFWVLSSLHLEVLRRARIGETLKLATWPGVFRRLYALRHFSFTDGNGAEVARASSQWMILSTASGRPQRTEAVVPGIPNNTERPVYFEFGAKIPVAAEAEAPEIVPVRYSMEDVNGHLNNAGYVGIAQDWLDCRLDRPNGIREIEIAFHSAVRAPETLAVSGEERGSGVWLVAGRRAGGELSFACRLTEENAR